MVDLPPGDGFVRSYPQGWSPDSQFYATVRQEWLAVVTRDAAARTYTSAELLGGSLQPMLLVGWADAQTLELLVRQEAERDQDPSHGLQVRFDGSSVSAERTQVNLGPAEPDVLQQHMPDDPAIATFLARTADGAGLVYAIRAGMPGGVVASLVVVVGDELREVELPSGYLDDPISLAANDILIVR